MTGAEPLRAAFRSQARACARLDSPFMERLLMLLSRHWDASTALARHLDGFSGDIGPAGHSLPLRVAGGLHALVLSGRDPGLAAVYPPTEASDEALWSAVRAALRAHEDFLIEWCRRAPQTNEVRRSAALIAGASVVAARYPLPLRLSELGASAGLNLMFDRYALDLGDLRIGPPDATLVLRPDWRGPPPPQAALRVASRRGADLAPVDLDDPEQVLRLMSYLWADQPERMSRTRTAIRGFDAVVDRADAVDWLEQRLATAPAGQVHLVYSTVAWQYFPPQAQARGTALMEDAGARATQAAPLAWLSMESDGRADGAALTLRLWPGDLRLDLGRIDFHGRWVDWAGTTAG